MLLLCHLGNLFSDMFSNTTCEFLGDEKFLLRKSKADGPGFDHADSVEEDIAAEEKEVLWPLFSILEMVFFSRDIEYCLRRANVESGVLLMLEITTGKDL